MFFTSLLRCLPMSYLRASELYTCTPQITYKFQQISVCMSSAMSPCREKMTHIGVFSAACPSPSTPSTLTATVPPELNSLQPEVRYRWVSMVTTQEYGCRVCSQFQPFLSDTIYLHFLPLVISCIHDCMYN